MAKSRYLETREKARASDFWVEASKKLHWEVPPEKGLDDTRAPLYAWFSDGVLNTCYNAVDRHVDAGNGDKTALIYDSAMTGQKQQYTYNDLKSLVSQTAGMLAEAGVVKGDRIVIYMPMVPETVFAMLACARIGAVHSVVFGGFAAKELAKRIDDAKPKLILSASCGLEPGKTVAYKPLLDDAIALSTHKPSHCIILQRLALQADLAEGRDIDWACAYGNATAVDCVPVQSTDPLYILYTSGTTGVPKGVVRDNGGHATALHWSMENIYNAQAGDVFWAASDVGWVVGHSYIVYAPLLLGCTSVLYEGKPVGTPDASAFWRVVEDYSVSTLFTAPTAIRAIKKEDPSASLTANHDLSSLRALFLAGERADPDTIHWSGKALNVPVIDHWWQTELGWPALAVCLGLGETETRVGSAGKPVPGYEVACLDNENQPLETGESGDLVLKLPLPPGCLPTLWNSDDGYEKAYLSAHPGYYHTGDAGFIDDEEYVHVMSRTDDIINVAGHRLSTGAIEQVVSAHKDVAECAVIGAADTLKGEVPVAFIVLNQGVATKEDQLVAEVIGDVRKVIGPVAAFKSAAVVAKLPKTRSGKTLRGTMKAIMSGQSFEIPATIEDASALDTIKDAMPYLCK